ncbi:MAG: hypothetical protein KGY48_08740, partial [Wenzhouxiangellaceae bacterium]|nr:hypothetical protein [Wenzhouxiangellaceae bacterium]
VEIRVRVSGFGFPERQSRWSPDQVRGDETGVGHSAGRLSVPGRRRNGWFGSPVVQRFGSFVEDFDVLAVGVDPIALPAGSFLDDARAPQGVYGARGRWKSDICAPGRAGSSMGVRLPARQTACRS